jgi:hypothetical protein
MFERFLKSESEKEKHADEIMGLLKDSPTLEALRDERQAKINADRCAALDRIAAAERERDETLPPLYERLEAARLRIEELEAKFKADLQLACSERDKRDYEHTCAKFRLDKPKTETAGCCATPRRRSLMSSAVGFWPRMINRGMLWT